MCLRPVRTRESIVDEIKGLRKTIADNNLEFQDVPPDGNCLFAAVVDQLFTQGNFLYTTERLRQTVVNYLRQNPGAVRVQLCVEIFQITTISVPVAAELQKLYHLAPLTF